MSKRQQPFQGGEERYTGMAGNSGETADAPRQATAAQMAKRRIAQARKPSGSQRSSRATTPSGNVFSQQPTQQSMPSFQLPGQSGTGFGGDFNFSVNASSNPFAQTNGTLGTPPPNGFQFDGPPQQNGRGSGFGDSGANFGSNPFGASSNTQTQQNGFTPSTTIFGQSQPSGFGGFGQTNTSQSQTNGLTPSTITTSSFPSFGKETKSENPFKSAFGGSQPQTQSTPGSSFTFGQSTQPSGDKPSTPSFIFGQTSGNSQPNGGQTSFGSTAPTEPPKPATSSVFSGFGQQNGSISTSQADQTPKPATSTLFGAQSTSLADSTPKSTTNSLFGTQSKAGSGLFGSTPPPDSASQTPKLGDSIFSSLNKKDGITPNMFTSSRDSTPKPSAGSIFPAPPSEPSNAITEQTPKPTNIFGAPNASQATNVKPSQFGSASTSAAEQQTPKPNANLFSTGTSQSTSKPTFTFGQTQQQDTSMTTPGNTPQKQIEASSQKPSFFATQSTPARTSANDSTAPTPSLFDRITSNGPPATAQKTSFAPSTSFFNAPKASESTDQQAQKTPSLSQTGSMFSQMPRDPSVTAAKSSSTGPGSIMSNKPSAAPWLSHGPSALTSEVLASQTSASFPTPKPVTTSKVSGPISEEEKNTLKVLNEGLRAHLAKQNPTSDWTAVMEYYITQAAKIRKMPAPQFDVPNVAITAPSTTNTPQKPPPSNLFARQAPTSPIKSSLGNLFENAAATPKGPSSSLLKPPSTAPVNRKRPAEDDAVQPPATEKRARADPLTEYPKLPDNASETSKLFQAALDRSTGAKSSFSSFVQGQAQKEKENQPPQNSGGFNPSTAGFAPSTAGFQPSAPSGMPTFSAPSAGTGNFLAAFGKKANEQEEKDRKKRKMEDYDSDEETEEAWAARDKLEQEAKRQKILDAAKSGAGFTPSNAGTPTGGTPAPESDDGGGSDLDSETCQGRSLFDRITPRESPVPALSKTSAFTPDPSKNIFASKTPSGLSAPPMTSNIFGSLSKPRESIEQPDNDKTEAEKEQGSGDNTWKPNTPIKFGGTSTVESTTPKAPPPTFGNLFGQQKSSQDSVGHLNVPKPSFVGFNFGGQPSSLTNSRATTPGGFTTDGEGASTAGEGEEDDAPPTSEPQVEDQTGLRDSEKENEDVLFSLPIAKAMKQGEKKNEAGEMSIGWVDRGKGPLYILKHKDTGKVRVVLKVPPYGVTKMNFAPIKDMQYEVTGSSGKLVQGAFIDHLDAKDGKGKLGKWMLQVGKKEDAAEIAKVLMRERA